MVSGISCKALWFCLHELVESHQCLSIQKVFGILLHDSFEMIFCFPVRLSSFARISGKFANCHAGLAQIKTISRDILVFLSQFRQNR